MPICEYKCQICHQHFEIQTAGIDEDMEIACPKCRSTEVKKAENATGISSTLFPSLGGRFT